MPSKAPIERVQPPQAPTISGKWLIIGVVTVAIVGAVGSWIFRYYTTHRIAQFWGPTNSQLIRDAPTATLTKITHVAGETPKEEKFDMSEARGLVHLRNALLENQGFNWTNTEPSHPDAGWLLEFRDTSKGNVVIAFSADCGFCWMPSEGGDSPRQSCAPIAPGLLQIFREVADAPVQAEGAR